jgi:hypothetical protein
VPKPVREAAQLYLEHEADPTCLYFEGSAGYGKTYEVIPAVTK